MKTVRRLPALPFFGHKFQVTWERHLQIQLDPNLLLRLWRDTDLLIFLAESRQYVLHLLLAELAADAVARTA